MFGALLAVPFIGAALKILTSVLEAITPLLKGTTEALVWFVKEFFTGLGVIFDNKSTLLVLIACVLGGGYYFRTWDNAAVLKDCNAEVKAIEEVVPKKLLPPKVHGHYRKKQQSSHWTIPAFDGHSVGN